MIKTVRFSVSTPLDLMGEFDNMIKRMKYDRSKAIQIAMRNFLSEHSWTAEEGEGAGAIVILYSHRIKGLEEELTEIQHHNNNIISSSLHIHLEKGDCLEVIAVKGNIQKIREFSKKIMVKRGIKELKIALTRQY
jgi:CopG family nickel-responsive transcriptional regulator